MSSTNTIRVDNVLYETEYLSQIHPGGPLFVELFDGRDATHAFQSYHRRRFPHDKMRQYQIEVLGVKSNSDPEFDELCKEINHILPVHASFAPWYYYVKISSLLCLAFYTEYQIHAHGAYVWYNMVFLGWLFALIGLNIQHDANHGAISRHFWINRLFGMSQNWIGGSAIDWMHQHVVQHHIHCNDVERDPDIVGNSLLRLNPLKPLLPIHLYQYIYLFALLCMFGVSYSIDSVTNNYHMKNHTNYAPVIQKYMNFEKAFGRICLFRWILFPVIFARTNIPFYMTMFHIAPVFIVGGFYLSFFFILSHNYDGVSHYNSQNRSDRSDRSESFLRKQIQSSSNVGGELLCFINGGLNYQIEHHLFPRISHCHYPIIAPYVKAFCDKKNIRYTHFPTILENLHSCLKHLHTMGSSKIPAGFSIKEKND